MIRIVPSSADRIVAPTRAVRPRRQGADDQNDQNDKDDKPHFGLCLGRPLARGRPNNAKIRETFPMRSANSTAANNAMRQAVDILSISTRGRGLVEITREVLNWLKPHARPSRAFDFILPAYLGRIAHPGERRAGRSRRSRDVFRPPGAGGRRPISARRRRPRRHARPYPHGPDRRAAGDSDRRGGARLGNLARYLLVRASACAASATDCLASYWRMTAGA